MFVVLEETEEENREQLVVAYSPHSWIHLIFYERWQKCDIQSQRLKFSNKRYRTESLLVNGNNNHNNNYLPIFVLQLVERKNLHLEQNESAGWKDQFHIPSASRK